MVVLLMLVTLAVMRRSANSSLIYVWARRVWSLPLNCLHLRYSLLHLAILSQLHLNIRWLVLFLKDLLNWLILNSIIVLEILRLKLKKCRRIISWYWAWNWLILVHLLRSWKLVGVSLRRWTHYSIWATRSGWLNFSLQCLNSFYYFHSMESQDDSKVLLKVCVSNILYDLAVDTDLFELFAVLG